MVRRSFELARADLRFARPMTGRSRLLVLHSLRLPGTEKRDLSWDPWVALPQAARMFLVAQRPMTHLLLQQQAKLQMKAKLRVKAKQVVLKQKDSDFV